MGINFFPGHAFHECCKPHSVEFKTRTYRGQVGAHSWAAGRGRADLDAKEIVFPRRRVPSFFQTCVQLKGCTGTKIRRSTGQQPKR